VQPVSSQLLLRTFSAAADSLGVIDTSIDLQEFDEAYASAPTSIGEVSDGTYNVRVTDVSLLRSRAGNPMLVWDLRILGPRVRGPPA